jgi:hypothetical protein
MSVVRSFEALTGLAIVMRNISGRRIFGANRTSSPFGGLDE